jgi:hypothetical protein
VQIPGELFVKLKRIFCPDFRNQNNISLQIGYGNVYFVTSVFEFLFGAIYKGEMSKKVIFVSNDYSFLPALRAVKKHLPAHFDFFIHSEFENGDEHSVDLKRKSVMDNILSQADYLMPVFTGLLGIYLTEILVHNLNMKENKCVLIKDVVWQYVEKDVRCCREERTINNILEQNTDVYASFSYFFLENKTPHFLKQRLACLKEEDFLTDPSEFLIFVVEKILKGEAFGYERVYSRLQFMPESRKEELPAKLRRKNFFDFFHYLGKVEDWQYALASVKYLNENEIMEVYQ